MSPSGKTNIAFVKFGGLAAGGTEKFLQAIAANLSKEKYDVDYYYCGSAPYIGSDWVHPDTDASRKAYMQDHGVNLIEFHVKYKDITDVTHKWIGTDFWTLFDESKYDIIQTARAGHPEYPFCKIKHTPIVDSLHLSAGVDNQFNIARVMHISQWSADKWIAAGGDAARVVFVSHPIDLTEKRFASLRTELGLDGKFVFGLHQRDDENIFSEIPLQAYKETETPDTAFVLMGGGDRYRKQAADLNIKNIHFLPFASDMEKICQFLATLNVYAHGRKDGEVNSTAMAEAMFFGLPIVSHTSHLNNGHIDSIGEAGVVVETVTDYAQELRKLKENTAFYAQKSAASRARFAEHYELSGQINKISAIYQDVIRNPFQGRVRKSLLPLFLQRKVPKTRRSS